MIRWFSLRDVATAKGYLFLSDTIHQLPSDRMSASIIDTLPLELVICICALVVSRSLSNRQSLRLVCKLLRDIVDTSPQCWRDVEFEHTLWNGGDTDLERLQTSIDACNASMLRAHSASLDLSVLVMSFQHVISGVVYGLALKPLHCFHRRVQDEVDGLFSRAAPQVRSLRLGGMSGLFLQTLGCWLFSLFLAAV